VTKDLSKFISWELAGNFGHLGASVKPVVDVGRLHANTPGGGWQYCMLMRETASPSFVALGQRKGVRIGRRATGLPMWLVSTWLWYLNIIT